MTDDHDPRVDAAAHLQQALIEMIGATRAVLDLAEQAVREPGGLATIVTDTLAAFLAAIPKSPMGSNGPDPTTRHEAVEHIRIS